MSSTVRPQAASAPAPARIAATERRDRFDSLCTPLRDDVFRYTFWLCRNRELAEDVVQETMLRAWTALESLTDERAARPWLLTIARRELARSFSRKRRPTVSIDEISDSDADILSVPDQSDLDEMRRAILALPWKYREPLALQVLFGYSTVEIAAQMDINQGAVLSRLFRAREQLRAKFGMREAEAPPGIGCVRPECEPVSG